MQDVAVANLIVDNREDGLFRVNRQVFTEPDIMALDQQRVFE